MAFGDLAKHNASFAAGHHAGEEVEYRQGPSSIWVSMNAIVERNPVGELGEILQNTIDVFISKTDVLSPNVGSDYVRLPLDQQLTEPAPLYRLAQVTDRGFGSWGLRFVK